MISNTYDILYHIIIENAYLCLMLVRGYFDFIPFGTHYLYSMEIAMRDIETIAQQNKKKVCKIRFGPVTYHLQEVIINPFNNF